MLWTREKYEKQMVTENIEWTDTTHKKGKRRLNGNNGNEKNDWEYRNS